jgi:hypothetical protein
MKNHKTIKGKKKFRRVQKCMAVMCSAKVGSVKHKYKEISVSKRAGRSQLAPEPHVFVPPVKQHSTDPLELQKIVSTSQKTDHYSPGSDNWSVRIADLACLRVASKQKKWDILGMVWLGTFIRPKHRIVMRHKKSSQWYFAVLNFTDSAVLMHPAQYERNSVKGKLYHTWSPAVRKDGPVIAPVYDINDYLVFVVTSE